jgi:hypothetical protein
LAVSALTDAPRYPWFVHRRWVVGITGIARTKKAEAENQVVVEVARNEAAGEIGERVSVRWDPNDAIILTT